MKKSTKIIAIAVVTLGVTSTVFAYGARHAWRMSPEDKAEYLTEKVTEKLELNTTQQNNLGALSVTLLSIMKDVRSGRTEHMEIVQQLLDEPTLDQAKVLEMIRQKTELMNTRAPEVVASVAGFLDSLDHEQKTLLREHLKNHRQHHNYDH